MRIEFASLSHTHSYTRSHSDSRTYTALSCAHRLAFGQESCLSYIHMDVSENIGTPESPHFNRVFHYKPYILGYPYFWKHPYIYIYIQVRTESTTCKFDVCIHTLHCQSCKVRARSQRCLWRQCASETLTVLEAAGAFTLCISCSC